MIKKNTLILSVVCFLVCIAALIILAVSITEKDPSNIGGGYTVLAVNDLGMHCYQEDYSSFLILPPGNTLKVQVFKKGNESAELIDRGLDISYEIIGNTTSLGKTNFWDYSKDYGYDVPPDIGITGNGLSGKFKLSEDRKFYEATGIPVTPYKDGSTEPDPFQMVRITVKDSDGKVLAELDNVVAPVSDEMKCETCHESDLDILESHDEHSGTELVKELEGGKRYKCSDCHKDNALGQPGKEGIPPLSQAVHGFHSEKVSEGSISPLCYSCHPGPVTKCYRGRMYTAGIKCDDPRCHGSMENNARSQENGRQAWLQEPDCANCHGSKYAANADTLYRNSYLNNSPSSEMNGLILCESCHNGPHAEWKSAQAKDNLLPKSLLGYASYIDKCTVCHKGTGKMHTD
jgi:hypothetical protein